jgi:very-short-patch-repair endonuclease
MIISKIDGTICKNKLGLSTSLKKYGISLLEYYQKYENMKIPKCPYCEKNRKLRRGIKFNSTCGDKKCLKTLSHTKVYSEETKEKMRKKRFEYLSDKNNFQKTAWGKVANGLMTYGEEWLHNIFEENKIYSKYDVIFQHPVYPYFIDFAFINEKVAVEFDGKCHFINKKRRDHDITRDHNLEKSGWRVYRIAYDETESFKIEDLISFLSNSETKKLEERLIRSKELKTPKVDKRALNAIQYNEKNQRIAEELISSGIDFSSFGWVSQASKIVGLSDQKINGWMKRFLPEFYEINCFKRKSWKQ